MNILTPRTCDGQWTGNTKVPPTEHLTGGVFSKVRDLCERGALPELPVLRKCSTLDACQGDETDEKARDTHRDSSCVLSVETKPKGGVELGTTGARGRDCHREAGLQLFYNPDNG
jgi:hypothetical protein